MKCGGCVRAVEQRLLKLPEVQQASVNLLTRTAWVELGQSATDPLPRLLSSLEEIGFPARPRNRGPSHGPDHPSRRERLEEQTWWHRWRQLVLALFLVLISGAGHLADAGQLPWQDPWNLLGTPWVHALLASFALAGPGRPILVGGWRAALAGMPSMDSLVGLGVSSAYTSSLVGLLWPASGWPCFFHEPVMLLGFVLTGRFIEERARYRTGRAIADLAGLQPDHALLLPSDGPPRQVRVGGLRPGDRVRLLPGDRVPVDGLVIEGASAVDGSSLTGEPLPVQATPGSELAAGCLNLEAPLVLDVLRPGAESAIARIVHLVEQAQARKAPIQALADRIAGRFALGVLALATVTFLFWWLWGGPHWPELLAGHPPGPGGLEVMGHGAAGHGGLGTAATTPFALGLQLAIAVLVVACPCALGLATPTAMAVGSGLAARSGLLFRGGDAIEIAARLHTVLFDKTGTLTLGRPLVTSVHPVAGEGDTRACETLLQLAASLEQHSRHPLAYALIQEAQRRRLDLLPVAATRTVAGDGLEGKLEGSQQQVLVGRLGWLENQGIPIPPAITQVIDPLEAHGASLLAVAEGGTLLGVVAVEDQLRQDAAATVLDLRRRGLVVGMLSGDRRSSVERMATLLGMAPDQVAWELRPERKLQRINNLRSSGPLAMVGDGINDAPALAAADLGIAVGTGTQIAQDTADLVVMGDRLEGVVRALAIAAGTMTKVRQNLFWAFGYNLLVLPIAAGVLLPGFGMLLSPPLAALLMAASSITVVVNALLLPAPSFTKPLPQ